MGHLSEKGWDVYVNGVGGGYGAGPQNDGADACGFTLGNSSNTPIEAEEIEYDFFRVKRYELIRDSAGAGEYRGGMGTRRDFEILKDGVVFSFFSDRFKHPPSGLFGGKAGTCSRFVVLRHGNQIELPSQGFFNFRSNDILSVRVGGSGGYGDPRKRRRELVLKDLIEGRTSPKMAKEVYGLDSVNSE